MKMRTIFIVDDSDINLFLVKTTLKGLYKTYALPSASKMFNLISKIMPDLILLDVEMPEMNGYEAIQILKSDENLKHIPVIFLTARNDSESEIKAFELGAVDFISKPFTAPVLIKRIETHIKIDRLLKDIKNKNEELNSSQSIITQKNEQLIRMNEAKDNILAMISHDLKNYIGGILQAIELIHIKHNAFDNNRFIKMIEETATKALGLVREILLINKFEAENVNTSLTKTDINNFILESQEHLDMIAKQKGINIIFDFPNYPLFIMINPEKFHRAIDNLCINAIKFTKAQGTITVKTIRINKIIQIHIIDTGIGIPADMIDKIFDKYSKVGRLGTTGESSTGLGLYIVKQIIELHNGTIEVKSIVGEGTEFIIKISEA